jgi:Protein of unknown function (DUF2934)
MGLGTQANPMALHDVIAIRAYEIWESQGRPHGLDWAHWFEAESEISEPRATMAKPRTPRRPAKAEPVTKTTTRSRTNPGRRKS